MNVPPAMRRRLDELRGRSVNYHVDGLDLEHPPDGWNVEDRRQTLPPESPGPAVSGGSWEIARRLIRGYEFADPSIVRAFYDSDEPFPGRDMLLELRALGVLRVYVGVRVNDVYDQTRTVDGRCVRVFGWSYRTLEGHVERGQMDWEVWKWIDTGEVDFHVHAVSREASIANPLIRIGFKLLRGHERGLFLNSTDRRMAGLTELGVLGEGGEHGMREASRGLTARHLPGNDPAHTALARRVGSDRG
ncbi:MAG: DUF1990 domain-containing protein [Actinomycetota bacterium]|nr:DUF1990 domain-containing protein [Actinomycetota bacterium]